MQSFLEKAQELDALRYGDFTLKSGIKSNYFFDISKFFNASSLTILSKHYVDLILNNDLEFDCIFGPAYKGIPLAAAVGIEYYKETKNEISYVFDRKETKLHGEGGDFIGTLKDKKVLVIDMDPQYNSSMSFNVYNPNLSIYRVFSNEVNIEDTIQKSQIPNLNVISACEDLAAAEYELADDENRNFLLKNYINIIVKKP